METKEQVLTAIKAELDKWEDHSFRLMKSINTEYFQEKPGYFLGKIALIHDLRRFIYSIEHEDVLDGLKTTVEPDVDPDGKRMFQVSTSVSRDLMFFLKRDDELVKMVSDHIFRQIKTQISKL